MVHGCAPSLVWGGQLPSEAYQVNKALVIACGLA